jgi:hypothetical protein
VHEDQFLPPKLNARCRFVEETFAETSANGRDAPNPGIRATVTKAAGFDGFRSLPILAS